jgi:polysaccharide deacetylase family protein (PEP-CTERM system associated)
MNILTFDIEDWYCEKMYWGAHAERYQQYDRYLGKILDALDAKDVKGTFFCVGGMASDFPSVVKNIHKHGHEVGCHSHLHHWLNRMTKQEVEEDTCIAMDLLEQCIGEKVKSYRAPAFSIGESNKWAFEVLAECGIERDASVFPAVRDFGGFAQFGHKTPTMVSYGRNQIKEFPICTAKVLGKEIAYSGGGYFRFFPLSFVRKEMNRDSYSMTYFHIIDLVPENTGLVSRKEYEEYFKEPGTLKNRYMRYLKSNLGKKAAFDKLLKLIETEDFVNLEQADRQIDWNKAHTIVL